MMDVAVYYYSAGPFKKLLLCCLLCLPPGYLLLILIIMIYLAIMMILPPEPPRDQYNGNLRAPFPYEMKERGENYSSVKEHEQWTRNQRNNYYSPVNVEDYSQNEHDDDSSSDWESWSISSEDYSFSTSFSSWSPSPEKTFSTSASSLRARAELNAQAEDRIKQEHEYRRWERQMDNSPLPTPISSPDAPFYKMGKDEEGNWYADLNRDEVLIYIAYHQTLKEKRSRSTTLEGWWEAIIYGFFCATGIRYDKKQIKQRFSFMRKEWKAWSKIMNTAGFGWDPMEKTIIADQNCWRDYIECNPEAEKIRGSTFLLYEELTVIFRYLKTESQKEMRILEEYEKENRRNGRIKRPSYKF